MARTCTYLIAAMSVGFSCSVFAERFGGDAELSAQAIFTSTFFSLVTAPAVLAIAGRLGV